MKRKRMERYEVRLDDGLDEEELASDRKSSG
jgi:hypothetical protein